MNRAMLHGAGDFFKVFPAIPATTVTAAGAADNVYQAGIVIDRNDISELCHSAFLAAIATLANVSGGDDADFTFQMKHSEDAITWADYGTAKTDSETRDENTTYSLKAVWDIAGAYRYIRVDWKVDLSASGTDTAQVSGGLVLGPFNATPATEVTDVIGESA